MQNHYQTLGVHTTAEDIVIKAAYRVLAQKYHPDKLHGDHAVSAKKMREINEAYRILSDPDLRKIYDTEIRGNEFDANDDSDAQDLDQDFGGEVNQAWSIGVEFYPQIDGAYKRLRRVNIMLASSFKLYVVENKVYSKATSLAEQWERLFLERFFGGSELILEVVARLITAGDRDAVRKINTYVNALGSDVRPEWILEKVLGENYAKSKNSTVPTSEKKYAVYELMEIAKTLHRSKHVGSKTVEMCLILLVDSGGEYQENFDKFNIIYKKERVSVDPLGLLEFTQIRICPRFF